MTNIQIDILSVMSFNDWLLVQEIQKRLEVEHDYKFSSIMSSDVFLNVMSLKGKGWVESKPDETLTEEELEKRKGNRRFVYRRKRNGTPLPNKKVNWVGKLINAGN